MMPTSRFLAIASGRDYNHSTLSNELRLVVIPQSCSQFLNLRDRLGRRAAKELDNENPKRDGVLLVLALPSSVFGPVECWAFLRFVSILRGDVALVGCFVSSMLAVSPSQKLCLTALDKMPHVCKEGLIGKRTNRQCLCGFLRNVVLVQAGIEKNGSRNDAKKESHCTPRVLSRRPVRVITPSNLQRIRSKASTAAVRRLLGMNSVFLASLRAFRH
jgi:hypothetical protein